MANQGYKNFKSSYSSYTSPSLPVFPASDDHTQTSYKNNAPRYPSYYPNKQSNKQPYLSTKGNEHLINFGMHRGKTWYDIANEGCFSYLKWCLNTDTIQINSNSRAHIQTALIISKDKTAKWKLQEEIKECFKDISYVAKINGDTVTSPHIHMKFCITCNQYKMANEFAADSNLCIPCSEPMVDFNYNPM